MSKMKNYDRWIIPYDNDNAALSPEVWAQESLIFLENNMVAGMLVHRDFKNEIARFGQVVNTRQPAGFTAERKVDGDDVTVQNAQATNVAVRLDQHWHVSFLIYDGEESTSMQDLIDFHAAPALSAVAEAVDQVVTGEMYNFQGTVAGKLGSLSTIANGKPMIDLREGLTNNKCPMSDRRLLITPNVEGAFLNVGDFVNAHTVGDDGSALREGHLGRKYGFDSFTAQNTPSIAAGNTVDVTGSIDNGTGYGVGDTVFTVTGYTGSPTRAVGAFCTIAGDMTPQRIIAVGTNSAGNAVQLTVSPGLRYSVADSAGITIYTPGRINNGDGYAQYYTKAMTVKDFSVAPKGGQLIALGTAAHLFGAVGTPTTTSLMLNRSLDAAVAHEANVNLGPAGEYCWGFHKNAVSLVTRPLALPRAGTGVRSAVVSYNGLTIRATIGYNMTKQATQVTLDLLAGVKTLDNDLGGLMLA